MWPVLSHYLLSKQINKAALWSTDLFCSPDAITDEDCLCIHCCVHVSELSLLNTLQMATVVARTFSRKQRRLKRKIVGKENTQSITDCMSLYSFSENVLNRAHTCFLEQQCSMCMYHHELWMVFLVRAKLSDFECHLPFMLYISGRFNITLMVLLVWYFCWVERWVRVDIFLPAVWPFLRISWAGDTADYGSKNSSNHDDLLAFTNSTSTHHHTSSYVCSGPVLQYAQF